MAVVNRQGIKPRKPLGHALGLLQIASLVGGAIQQRQALDRRKIAAGVAIATIAGGIHLGSPGRRAENVGRGAVEVAQSSSRREQFRPVVLVGRGNQPHQQPRVAPEHGNGCRAAMHRLREIHLSAIMAVSLLILGDLLQDRLQGCR